MTITEAAIDRSPIEEGDDITGSDLEVDPTAGMSPEEKSIHAKRWWTLGVLCLSLVVIGVDNTILNVALPTLVTDIGATTSQLQWIVDGYTLVFAGLLLTMGSLGDRFGRRGALTIGLVIFGLGSVASAFASTAGALIATRSFMGLGAALMMPATLSIVTNVFRDAKERARAIAIWAGFSAIGIAFGPLLGGWLLEHFYWGSVFWVNVPIVIIALIGGRLFVPTSRDPEAPKLDPLGAVLSIVGLITLLWAIIEAPGKGWTSPEVVVSLAVGAAALISFALWENHTDHPMLDVKFFKKARFSAASIAVTLVFFAMLGSLFMLTQYLQFVLGFSALEAGIRIMPFALTMMVVAPLSARIVERIGTKVTVTAGLVIIASGLGLFATLQVDSAYPQLLGALVVLAFGMGLVMAPATESIMGSLPPGKAGVGSAVNDTTRQMGGALGVAVLGSAFASVYSSKIADALSGAGLPAEAVTGAQESMGGALHVAAQIGGPTGESIVMLARQAFVEALHPAVLVGAAVALVGAVITALFLPARAVDPVEAVIEGDIDSVNALTTADPAEHVDLIDLEPRDGEAVLAPIPATS